MAAQCGALRTLFMVEGMIRCGLPRNSQPCRGHGGPDHDVDPNKKAPEPQACGSGALENSRSLLPLHHASHGPPPHRSAMGRLLERKQGVVDLLAPARLLGVGQLAAAAIADPGLG